MFEVFEDLQYNINIIFKESLNFKKNFKNIKEAVCKSLIDIIKF